jgi:DNA repair exonuclease SbcCD ATPase subunit
VSTFRGELQKFDAFNLRAAITSNGGEGVDWRKIESRSAAAEWRRKNQELRKQLDGIQEDFRRLQEELDALRGRSGEERRPGADTYLEELKKENARLRKEYEKEVARLNQEVRSLHDEIGRYLQNPVKKKAP